MLCLASLLNFFIQHMCNLCLWTSPWGFQTCRRVSPVTGHALTPSFAFHWVLLSFLAWLFFPCLQHKAGNGMFLICSLGRKITHLPVAMTQALFKYLIFSGWGVSFSPSCFHYYIWNTRVLTCLSLPGTAPFPHKTKQAPPLADFIHCFLCIFGDDFIVYLLCPFL